MSFEFNPVMGETCADNFVVGFRRLKRDTQRLVLNSCRVSDRRGSLESLLYDCHNVSRRVFLCVSWLSPA